MAAIDASPPALAPSTLAAMTDETLVGLIAAGSDDAFAALDARYRRRLVRFAHGFVPGGTADAEDVVQDAMVRAVRALRNGSRPDAVGGWLHRITRNCALDLTASRRRHPVIELVDYVHPPAEDAQAAVERSLGVRGLVSDVSQLPPTQRSALVLRELEGRSYADIADELDTTVPAVKSLLVRARQGLKRARDGRRVAAWLPLPLLGRIVERASSAWEPLAAGATPKVACAAVVVAGSLPMMSGPPTPAQVDQPHPQHHGPAVTATAPPPKAKATGAPIADPTSATGAHARGGTAHAPADHGSTTAIATELKADCADGAIDGSYPSAAVVGALRASDDGQEYGGCKQALTQASLRVGGVGGP
ncbi:sigma-70 family RNA polymerase sigma factor [Baekduia sp.]|jgi:RNA polymerase sigma factor (sigma-70 family)|uniref:RNA polymerase sigma factor n=1 Tax=Baekduia sp. TaxID=2600305 RepID=UPI002DF78C62|nr:sigma-70 family RNA polymerase sigma factor [Baekduia sp.]